MDSQPRNRRARLQAPLTVVVILAVFASGPFAGSPRNIDSTTTIAAIPVSTIQGEVLPAGSSWSANVRVDDDAGTGNQIETTLAVDGKGTWYAGWVDDPQGMESNLACRFARSERGVAWSSSEAYVGSFSECANPAVVSDGSRGLYRAAQAFSRSPSLSSTIDVSRTLDGGRTWSPWIAATPSGVFNHRPSLAADGDSLALSWDVLLGGQWEMRFARSADGGQTWTSPTPLGSGKDSCLLVDPTGRIHLAWGTPALTYIASDDAGATWSSPRTIAAYPGEQYDVRPDCAMSSDGQYVYYVYSANAGGASDDIWIVRSVDAGASWSTPLKINDDANDARQMLPGIAIDAAGTVHVAWQDFRSGNMEAWYASSYVDSTTWSANQRISDRSGPAYTASLGGHTNNLAASPSGAIGYAWIDSRDNPPNKNDVYFTIRRPAPPVARAAHDLAYDTESDRVVMFGGLDAAMSAETWAYDFDTNTWANMAPATAPQGRGSPAMMYDSASDRVVLFGGEVDGVGQNDTWTYNFNANEWTRMNPATAPSPRWGHRMAYDTQSDRIVLFGGHTSQGGSEVFLYDTWLYDLDSNTWTNVTSESRPTSPDHCGSAYDVESDRTLCFGGAVGSIFVTTDETWLFDVETQAWTEVAPALRPSPRFLTAAAYDQGSDRVILFGGGQGTATGRADTWAYDANANEWSDRNPGTAPPGRLGHKMAHDIESDRVILFGGVRSLGGESFEGSWAYDYDANTWSPLTLPSAPQSLEASAQPDAVGLTWTIPAVDGDVPILNYRIYRGTTSGNLRLHAEVGTSSAFADSDVSLGVTYFYQVSAVTRAGEGPRSLEVQATPLDATDPTIAITFPSDGAMLNMTTVTITGTSSDNLAVSSVEVSLDGTNWVLAAGTTSWSSNLILAEGSNTIRSRAMDSSGNQAETSVSVTADITSPVVGISSPENLPLCTATTVTITGTAADNVAVERVEVSADRENWVLADGTTSWSAVLPLAGSTTVYARATDQAGNPSLVEMVHQDCAPFPSGVLVGGVGAAVAAAGIAFVLLRRRRHR